MEHPSIRRLLQQQFFKACVAAFSPSEIIDFQAQTIPLYRLKHEPKIVYRCSLALRLASQLQLSAVAIAQRLASHLIFTHPTLEPDSLEFTFELGEKGSIDCILSDRSLTLWLDRFPELFLSSYTAKEAIYLNSATENAQFPLQYTHVRCCALLRLGNLDGLIEFDTQQLGELRWLWNSPNPIPWEVYPKTDEFGLIAQILDLVDALLELEPKNYLILATQLCDRFWALERYCRIWGEIKQKNRKLAQYRLILVAMTQLILCWLLQEKFNVKVLVEL